MKIMEPEDLDNVPMSRWHILGFERSITNGVPGKIDKWIEGPGLLEFKHEFKETMAVGTLMQFKDGNRVVLHPDPEFTVSINGKATKPSGLRPGDQLNFYIPQSRLVAQLDETPSATPTEETPMEPAPAEEPAPAMAATEELPKTASSLPMYGLIGLALLALGAALTGYRLTRRSS